jgi:hypothetical protein
LSPYYFPAASSLLGWIKLGSLVSALWITTTDAMDDNQVYTEKNDGAVGFHYQFEKESSSLPIDQSAQESCFVANRFGFSSF